MAVIAAMTVALFSCKDDEDPVIPVVSFQQATRTVDESAGTIDIPVQLDVAAPNDIQIGYSLSGTASEGTSSSNDYQALGTFGTISIAKGSTSGTLQLQIRQDELVEADETIIITLSASSTATLGSVSTMTITLTSDDLGAKVSFTTTTSTVKESDGTLEIEVSLDKAPTQDLTVEYAFNYDDLETVATAIDTVFAYNYTPRIPSSYYDFYVVGGTYGELTIPAGSTSAKLTLRFYSDFLWDDDERIEINLTAAGTGGQLGTNTKHTVTVSQEDGRLIGLLWDPATTDVDMDLVLWLGDGTDFDAITGSINADVEQQSEEVFIPKVFTDIVAEEVGDVVFGVSAIYYEGTANPLNFEIHHVDFVDGSFEAAANRDIKAGAYTLANINAWEDLADVQIEHTFDLVAGVFTNLSEITIPASGSRQATYQLPASISKKKVRPNFNSHAPARILRK